MSATKGFLIFLRAAVVLVVSLAVARGTSAQITFSPPKMHAHVIRLNVPQATDIGNFRSYLGVELEPVIIQPRITQDQAVEVALKWVGPEYAAQVTRVQAFPALYTDHVRQKTDANGNITLAHSHAPFWIITLEGLNWPRPISQPGAQLELAHVIHISVDAQTGAWDGSWIYPSS